MNKQTIKQLKEIHESLLKCLYDAEVLIEDLVNDKQEKFDNLADNMWNTPIANDMDEELYNLQDILETITDSTMKLDEDFLRLGIF